MRYQYNDQHGPRTCETEPRSVPWHYFLLKDRIPLPGRTLEACPAYWQGLPLSEPELAKALAAGYDVGLLPERSGLAVLDCDVRLHVEMQSDNAGTVTERRGYDDLLKAAASRGKVVPPTYTVRSPSGGKHLYFAQNPDCAVTSKGHRKNWLIDVKASRNTFCVCPPSSGYTVESDVPVAEMPYWLARHAGRRLPASDAPRVTPGPIPQQLTDLIVGWLAAANHNGGWNDAIFKATCWFREAGMHLDDIIPLVLGAAGPADDREKAKAMKTIRSGWNR